MSSPNRGAGLRRVRGLLRQRSSILAVAGSAAVLAALAWFGPELYARVVDGPGRLPSTLTVGVDYVTPAFVGGDRVRTPATIDSALVDKLVAGQGGVAAMVAIAPQTSGQDILGQGALDQNVLERDGSGQGDVDVVLSSVALTDPALPGLVSIPTGYVASPMVIMRSDTDIKSLKQLAGRTVCVAEGSGYVGLLASRYQAIEQVYKAPADALLELRIGGCDATVHDDMMLHALLAYPEWKKFSASLTLNDTRELRFLAPESQPELVAALKQTTRLWRREDTLATVNKLRARDIAFEVYLDQAVTDCH